jgi:transposase
METFTINFEALHPHLNEKMKRLVAASLVTDGEYGTKSKVSRATGVSHREIRRGLAELNEENPLESTESSKRIRKEGGGRKKVTDNSPEIVDALLDLVESTTRGDPETPLLWTTKSLRTLADELGELGFKISHSTVGTLLVEQGYSLQGANKVIEGAEHPLRNEQFEFIYKRVKQYQYTKQPVISVDCKKHELVGNFKNNGREYHKKGEAPKVKDHDFMDKDLGKAIPYGVYDQINNCGFVNVGISKDTSMFAVQSIRTWWETMGKDAYPNATRLFVTADCGGSNGYRRKLWLLEMAKLATEIGLSISVSHYPVGTSKWNKIEHRLFSHISMNWRGRPLTTLEVIVNLIANTTTTTGLYVNCQLDENDYQTGIKVTDKELKGIKIRRNKFLGEWNYKFLP